MPTGRPPALLRAPRRCPLRPGRPLQGRAAVPQGPGWPTDGNDNGSGRGGGDSGAASWRLPGSSYGLPSPASPGSVSAASLPLRQQSLLSAFQVLDSDRDGLISQAQAGRLVALYLALGDHVAPPPPARPLTWDQHLLASWTSASKLAGGSLPGVLSALGSFVSAKLAGQLQKAPPPRCSDLAWAALGMFAAMLALGAAAGAARALPLAGPWHQQGLPLLLGSFGTISILLFGKPEADAVRLWPIIAGQLGATVIAVCVVQAFGAGLLSRAGAMAATVAYMMATDTVHPPGGALVLLAMDNASIQAIQFWYLLWPSLALCLAVLLPISAATNWLRRNWQFDAPGAAGGAATLQQKRADWEEQQRRKRQALQRRHSAALLLSDRIALPVRPHSGRLGSSSSSSSSSSSGGAGINAVVAGILAKHRERQRRQEQQQARQAPQPRQQAQQPPAAADVGSFLAAPAGPAATSAAPADAALRRRLLREADRQLEDEAHRRRLWGEALPGIERFERRLQRLHEERLGLPPSDGGAGGAPPASQPAGAPPSEPPAGSAPRDLAREAQQGRPPALPRPSWMYRWRSDISTTPGVGDPEFDFALERQEPAQPPEDQQR